MKISEVCLAKFVYTYNEFAFFSLLLIYLHKNRLNSRALHWDWDPARPVGPYTNLMGVGGLNFAAVGVGSQKISCRTFME